MADFKVVLSDPQEGISYKVEATGGMAGALIGKSVGDIIAGDALGFAGYQIAITGATDKTGIPARRDLPGLTRRKLLLANGTGFRPTYNGQRRRMTIRGAEINGDFVQINAKVVEYGEKSLKDYFAPAEAAAE
ncbi:30S ribosomal protein S6e [Methanogenium marinum]|uniref:Small ribosomal subunit protein eS6 n=1 Tax=Methanogenium marinum TaxID=348610 RepID=A0A9Q4KT27_9EURY|nr:30S ribosomal protein S6e [Methanogenium marinum]MDE4908084.1 30S ribosomal protein S6e [Methanogenium marinum]